MHSHSLAGKNLTELEGFNCLIIYGTLQFLCCGTRQVLLVK